MPTYYEVEEALDRANAQECPEGLLDAAAELIGEGLLLTEAIDLLIMEF